MKTLFSALTLSLLTLSATAHAVFDPSWERPVSSADMAVVNATGTLATAHNIVLTLNKYDGAKQATSMSFSYLPKAQSDSAFVRNLKVTSVRMDRCGGTVYEAEAYMPRHGTRYIRFEVTLNETRNFGCSDMKEPTSWTAQVREIEAIGGFAGEVVVSTSTMELSGTPEGVYTIQSLKQPVRGELAF